MAVTIVPFNPGQPFMPFERAYQNADLISQTNQRNIQNQFLPENLRIANALKQNELNFAPGMSAAELALKRQMAPYYGALTGEANARIPLIGAQVQEANARVPLIGKQVEAEDIANKLKSLQLQMTQSGQLPISGIGGLGSRYIGGRTYTDPNTGEVKSIPSTASTNYLQRATAASQQLKQILPEIVSGQQPYLGFKGAILKNKDLGQNYFGLGSDESIDRQTAYNNAEAGLNTATEQMMKAFGLNATNENFKNMRKVLEPRPGETAKGYEKRIDGEIEKLAKRQEQYENILQGGYTTGQNANPVSPMQLPQSAVQQQRLQQQFANTPLTVGPVGTGAVRANAPDGTTKTIGGKTYRVVNGEWHE